MVLRALGRGARRAVTPWAPRRCTTAASRDLWRAALLLWISPLRAARSSNCAAARYAALAWSRLVAVRTRFTAVRRAERWAWLWRRRRPPRPHALLAYRVVRPRA